MKNIELCMKYPNCKYCPISGKCERKEIYYEHRQNDKNKNDRIKQKVQYISCRNTENKKWSNK